jgi:hypothetical protein
MRKTKSVSLKQFDLCVHIPLHTTEDIHELAAMVKAVCALKGSDRNQKVFQC